MQTIRDFKPDAILPLVLLPTGEGRGLVLLGRGCGSVGGYFHCWVVLCTLDAIARPQR
jgi:hypothetical protein